MKVISSRITAVLRKVAVLAVLITGVVAVVGQRSASAATSTMWGVDTLSTTSASFFQQVDSQLGSPQFIGRYLVWNGTYPLTPAESASLHSRGLPIMLITSPQSTALTTAALAQSEANKATARARALGVPTGVAVFRDVEASYTINAAYIEAWYSAVKAAGYIPGFYENPLTGSSDFSGAYCAAVKAQPTVASTALYSDEDELDSYKFPRADMPAWTASPTPAVPGCANTTVAWQYKENDPNVNVDVDEFNSRYSGYLWSVNPYSLTTWEGSPAYPGVPTSARLGMAPGTSPAITSLGNGKIAVAFQANTGKLWTWQGAPGTTGTGGPTSYGMAKGASPSITSLGSGKIAVAFRANTGKLWTWRGAPGTGGGAGPTSYGMAAGTNPSITTLTATTIAVAFQANTGKLWTWRGAPGTGGGAGPTGYGMARGASPSVTTLTAAKVAVAFQANTGALWSWGGPPGTAGSAGSSLAAVPSGTRPSITAISSGTVDSAF